jgi:hypothetical protein
MLLSLFCAWLLFFDVQYYFILFFSFYPTSVISVGKTFTEQLSRFLNGLNVTLYLIWIVHFPCKSLLSLSNENPLPNSVHQHQPFGIQCIYFCKIHLKFNATIKTNCWIDNHYYLSIYKQIIAFCEVNSGKLKVVLSLCHALPTELLIKTLSLSHEEKDCQQKNKALFFIHIFCVIIGFRGSCWFFFLLTGLRESVLIGFSCLVV